MQTLVVLTVVAVAAFYVTRAFWPDKSRKSGCGACPQNPKRRDDYT